MKNRVAKTITVLTGEKFQTAYTGAVAIAVGTLLLASPAYAQASLKSTAVNVFYVLYGLVAVIGGICFLAHTINWKAGNFFGVQDPKKSMINTLLATGLGLGVVGIIQAVKNWVGSGGDIGSL